MNGRDMTFDVEIDAVGLLCPLPVLRLQKALRTMKQGEFVLLRASDPMAVIDVPSFCAGGVGELVEYGKNGGEDFYLVRKLEL